MSIDMSSSSVHRWGWHQVRLNVVINCLFFSLGSELMESAMFVDVRVLRSLCSVLILSSNLELNWLMSMLTWGFGK